MEKLINIIHTQKNIKAIIEVEKGLDNKVKIEEAWWSQRAKSVKLLEGDKKMKNFHQRVQPKEKRYNINQIRSHADTIQTNDKDIFKVS